MAIIRGLPGTSVDTMNTMDVRGYECRAYGLPSGPIVIHGCQRTVSEQPVGTNGQQ